MTSSPLFAEIFQAQGRYFRRKTYLGLNMPFSTISSDFATPGTSYSDILATSLNSTANTSGLGILAGIMFDEEEHLSGFINYMLSRNQGSLSGVSYDNTLNIVSLDLRYEFRSTAPIRPFVLGGLNAARVLSSNELGGSATYDGYGLDLGIGIAFYPYRRFGITASVLYRAVRFYQTAGLQYYNPTVIVSGVNFFLGFEYAVHTSIGCRYRPPAKE